MLRVLLVMLVVRGCFAVSQTAPIFRCRLGRLVRDLSKQVLLAMLRVLLVMLVVRGCFAVSQTAPIFRCRLGRLVRGLSKQVLLAMLRVLLVMLVMFFYSLAPEVKERHYYAFLSSVVLRCAASFPRVRKVREGACSATCV